MPQLNLFGGYYTHPSKPISIQNSINYIPVVVEQPGLNNNALIGMKGITQLGSVTGLGRGSQTMGGVLFSVNGNTLYSIDSSGVGTSLGTVEGSVRVSMAHNGTKLCIVVPGGKAYVYDGAFAEITDVDYITSDTVVFKDGYYIFTATAGNVFFVSALNDPTSIDPLDFGTAEIDPDRIVAGHVDHNELFILGEETIEVFQNIGGSGFPFQRVQGAIISKGCTAKYTPIEFDNSFVFIGGGKNENAAVWRVASSQSAVKISTDAIDNEIQKYTEAEVAEAFSFTFAIDGQYVIGFTFESIRVASATYCYNRTSGQWFQLQSGLTPDKWRINSITRVYDKNIVTDSEDGRIGFLSDTFDEYGNTIRRERTTQPFITDGKAQYWAEIEILMETGVGLESGDAPQIRLSHSDDGGRTFSAEKSRSFGKVGEYNKRPVWRRLGHVPIDRVYRFTITDPVSCNLIGMYGELEVGHV